MIGAGKYSAAVGAALKVAEAELEQAEAMSQAHPRRARKTSSEPVERRVARMRERLAKGGEIAHGVLRQVFPDSIWLQADESGKHFWAISRTVFAPHFSTIVATLRSFRLRRRTRSEK
jgi:hypothetical protein